MSKHLSSVSGKQGPIAPLSVMPPTNPLELRAPRAELLLAAAQAEVALFRRLLSMSPSLVDLIIKGSSHTQVPSEMLGTLIAAQEQGAAAHSALQLVRADKLTQHNRDSLTKCKAETKAAITQIGDLIKRTHTMGNCSTELIASTPLLKKTQEHTLFTAMISHRASFWAALYEIPLVQSSILKKLLRIVEKELLPEPIIFITRSDKVSTESLIERAGACVTAASTLSAIPSKEDPLYATQKKNLVELLLRVPIHPEESLLLFNKVRASAASLATIETKIKCKHGTLTAAEHASDPDLLRFKELQELLGGDALHAHKTISHLTSLQAPYIAIKSHLLVANMRLVLSIVNGNQKLHINFEDLSQDGHLGVLRAIEKFDPNSGWKFSTYAVWWIRQTIGLGNQQVKHLVAIPASQSAKVLQISRLLATEPGNPGIEDIAERLNLSKEDILALLPVIQGTRTLNKPISSGNSETLLDSLADHKTDSTDLALHKTELTKAVQESLNRLHKREREILNFRFGLQGAPPMTLKEIGVLLRMTRERVRQIENEALARLAKQQNHKILAQLFTDRLAI